MDCTDCRHPLSLHDPCSAQGCQCRSYQPAGRKTRAALITDHPVERPTIDQARALSKGIK